METNKNNLLLRYLRQNARQRLTTISKKTRIPISTLYDKLKAFQNQFIQKHTTLVNFNALGYQCRAVSFLKVDIQERNLLKDALSKHESVNSLYQVNNGFDFMVEGVFRTVKELEDFLESLAHRFSIKSQQNYYIIEDIKREGFLADPELAFS